MIFNEPIFVNQDIVFREEEDGAFLFNPDTGDLKCLNPIGSVIWRLCDGSLSMREIKGKITSRYSRIDPETIHGELESFLGELFDIGYIAHQVSGFPESL